MVEYILYKPDGLSSVSGMYVHVGDRTDLHTHHIVPSYIVTIIKTKERINRFGFQFLFLRKKFLIFLFSIFERKADINTLIS